MSSFFVDEYYSAENDTDKKHVKQMLERKLEQKRDGEGSEDSAFYEDPCLPVFYECLESYVEDSVEDDGAGATGAPGYMGGTGPAGPPGPSGRTGATGATGAPSPGKNSAAINGVNTLQSKLFVKSMDRTFFSSFLQICKWKNWFCLTSLII